MALRPKEETPRKQKEEDNKESAAMVTMKEGPKSRRRSIYSSLLSGGMWVGKEREECWWVVD